MTNTVMFDLQAAAMAAAASESIGGMNGAEDIPEGGVSFSDMLSQAAQAGAAADQAVTDAANGTAEGGMTSEAENPDGIGGIFRGAIKLIDNSDDGVKKALQLLLKTVLNAMKGPDDGKERKTDLFMLLSDTGAGLEDSGDDLLLGAEIMEHISFIIEAQTDVKTEADSILAGIEEIVSRIFGSKKDDPDENTAAEALAAMLNIQPEEIESYVFEAQDVKAEAVTNAAEAFKAPMEAVREKMPEKVSEAEKLYSEFEAAVSVKTEAPEEKEAPAVSVSFAALRINNAAEQVDAISVRTAAENPAAESADNAVNQTETSPVRTEAAVRAESAETNEPESGKAEDSAQAADLGIAALNAGSETVEIRETVSDTETVSVPRTAVQVERQVAERLEDEIAGFGDKDGVKELVLILRPKELGEVAVRLVKENGAVSVMLSAQYEEIGKLMAERAAYLGSSLSNQDYEVKDIQVVEPGNAAEQMGLNFTDRGFSFAGNNQRQEQNYRGENDGYGEIDEANEIDAGYGGIRLKEARLWTTA